MAAGVKEIDRGWKRIQREFLAKSGGAASRVGVQGPEADAEDHPGMTNVKLFSIHEFGSPKANIPERPVFRSVFDAKRKSYERSLAKMGRDLLLGKTTREAELRLIGEDYRADMIDYVRKGKVKPPLAQATVEARLKKGGPKAAGREGKKGRSENIPLWDTGQMLGSLSVVLEK